jgi:hypothetical protein
MVESKPTLDFNADRHGLCSS